METEKKSQILVLLAVLTFLYPACTQAEAIYEVIDLGTLGGNASWASSINDKGQIVGEISGSSISSHATLFDPTGAGNNVILDADAGMSWAMSINNAGQIVGECYNHEPHAYLNYSQAVLFDITGEGKNMRLGSGSLYSINDSGQIVGFGLEVDDNLWREGALIFDPTGAEDNIYLGSGEARSINNIGQIVGWAKNRSRVERATLFDPTGEGNNIDLGTLGGDQSWAYSINDTGQIVGQAEDSEGREHATFFDPTGAGNNIDLGTLEGDRSGANAINDVGQVVGWATNKEGSNWRAAIFDPSGAGNNIDLNTLIDPNSGWTLESANDINNNGWIVGGGINPEGIYHAFLLVPISTKYSGGTGEPNDPYQIATAEDLMLLGETPEDYDKHFILTVDIDLDPNLPGGKVFDRAVIAPDVNDTESAFQGTYFRGVFDGNDHVITNLTIKGGGYLGLFGASGSEATISNLDLRAVDVNGAGDCIGSLLGQQYGNVVNCNSIGTVSGNDRVGGLVGESILGKVAASNSSGQVNGSGLVGGLIGMNDASTIECWSSARVKGVWTVAGGLVGSNWGSIVGSCSSGPVQGEIGVGGLIGANFGDVSNCYSNGTVNGINDVGGLLGINQQYTVGDANSIGTVAMSYSTGPVTGVDKVGGLAGSNLSEIHTSFSRSTVDGDTDVGGLVGSNGGGLFGHVGITDSYWDIETSGEPNMCGFQSDFAVGCDNSYGKTTAEMKQQSTFEGWDFVDETVNGTDDVWKIVEGQTYPLLFWQKYDGGTGEPNDPYLIYTVEHLNELGAELNDYDKHFKLMADIDLSGYTYDRAVIAPDVNDVEDGFQGIPFTGTFDGSGHAISHLTIDGGSYLGLFGNLVNFSTIITNVRLESVNVSGTGDCVGSLVGQNYAKIVSCHSSGTIVGKLDVGGLVGRNYFAGSRILESSSKCTVMGDMSVGGLVGFMSSGRVKQCFSTGAVTGKTLIGGLVGLNGRDSISSGGFGGNPYVEDSYSTSTVLGVEDGDVYRTLVEVGIGGLVGFSGGYVYDSYSTGFVSGSGINVGGLVGDTGEWSGFVERSFWDTETSGMIRGGFWPGDCTGLITAEMQTASTFLNAGWDFVDETENGTDDIWWILEGQDYPRLWWQLSEDNQ